MNCAVAAVFLAGSAFHAFIPVSENSAFVLHAENSMGAHFDAPAASGAFF
jgi:hypothetical protein